MTKTNPQPPVKTVILPGDSQFRCKSCGRPGDRIVDCQEFGGELVGGRQSCESCAVAPPAIPERRVAAQR